MRDSFVFYKSFYEGLQLLETDEAKLRVFYAICDFAFNDKEIDESKFTKAELILMKITFPLLTAAKNNFERGMKGREYGIFGGRPKMDPTVRNKILEEVKQGISREFICQKYSISDKTIQRILKESDENNISDKIKTSGQNPQNPNVNLNDNVNLNSNVNDNLNLNDNDNVNVKVVGDLCPEKADKTDKTILSAKTTTTDYFSIPTLEEVKNFAIQKKLNIDPVYFWNYYDARKWENVINWKTTALGWAKRERNPNASNPKTDSNNPYERLGVIN